jgi:putative chitinase
MNLHKLSGRIPNTVLHELTQGNYSAFQLNNLRAAHFLAQCAHESANFSKTTENLGYSTKRLKEVFPGHFPKSLADTEKFTPRVIGSKVYANKNGNGNEASGDGYTYRGRGYLQLTGKANYQLFELYIEAPVVENPGLVATHYPLTSALFFFESRQLFTLCDQGPGDAVVKAITKKVNGGAHGLSERIRLFKEFYELIF